MHLTGQYMQRRAKRNPSKTDREETRNVTYKEARVYLDERSKYGSVLGLDAVQNLLRELGNPQDMLKFVHIAGTNGKGSVLAYTSTILCESGYRVGRYVSPTVVSYLERIQVDGKWIPEAAFAELVEAVQKAIVRMEAKGEASPTVFEAETAMAFLYFQKSHCDLVVLETGLGGDMDATNVISNTIVAAFTSISRDHMGFLGDTLEEIADHKSGIIKSGCKVVTTIQHPAVLETLKRHAKAAGCKLTVTRPELAVIEKESWRGQTFSYAGIPDIYIPLAGKHQMENALVSCEIIQVLKEKGFAISDAAILKGFAGTRWTGRFTAVHEHPLFLVDGAHNVDAAQRLREAVEQHFKGRRLLLIMGVFKDKEYHKIAEIMGPLADRIYTIELPDTDRTLDAESLKSVVAPYCSEVIATTIEEAVFAALGEARPEDVILAFGSLSYLGQVMDLVENMGGVK